MSKLVLPDEPGWVMSHGPSIPYMPKRHEEIAAFCDTTFEHEATGITEIGAAAYHMEHSEGLAVFWVRA